MSDIPIQSEINPEQPTLLSISTAAAVMLGEKSTSPGEKSLDEFSEVPPSESTEPQNTRKHRFCVDLSPREAAKLDEFMKLCKGGAKEGWKKMSPQNGVAVDYCYPEIDKKKSGLCMIRASVSDQIITPEFMFAQVISPEAGKALDPMNIHQTVVDQADPTRFILHAIFELPFKLSNRDFVFETFSTQLNRRQVVTIGWSVPPDHAMCMPEDPDSKIVRGAVTVAGYLFEANEGLTRCTFTYIIHIDVKGWLPKWVVNLTASDQASNVARVRDLLTRFHKKFQQEADTALLVDLPLTFAFYKLYGAYLPFGDKPNVYRQVTPDDATSTILWKDKNVWRFSDPEDYHGKGEDCLAFREGKDPFAPGAWKVKKNLKERSEFMEIEDFTITYGRDFFERLGLVAVNSVTEHPV